MPLVQSARFRLTTCLIWCFCWPGIAVLLLTPLPFGLISRSDLLGHFLLFGVMSFLVIAFARRPGLIVALGALSIALGTALEFAQAYVPGRTFDVLDAVANALGGIAGCLSALAVLKYWQATTAPDDGQP